MAIRSIPGSAMLGAGYENGSGKSINTRRGIELVFAVVYCDLARAVTTIAAIIISVIMTTPKHARKIGLNGFPSWT